MSRTAPREFSRVWRRQQAAKARALAGLYGRMAHEHEREAAQWRKELLRTDKFATPKRDVRVIIRRIEANRDAFRHNQRELLKDAACFEKRWWQT